MLPTNINGHYARVLTQQEKDKLSKDMLLISEYKQNKIENEAKKNWDLFYKRNKTKFFKDRHWTKREFEELTNCCTGNGKKNVLLEIGCGVGNFIFPLIEDGIEYFINACDFSHQAIDLLKENKLYDPQICNAFVCDVTKEELCASLEFQSIDIATLIFVLSAIHPRKMNYVLNNVFKVLKPGGMLLIRDYGLYDQAMLRFAPGHKLSENFYVRQDGTRAYYFSEDFLAQLASSAGYQVITNTYVSRQTINHKENISVPRVYIQAKLLKPE